MNTVEPIKDLEKITAMKKVLRAQNSRNYLLFTMGINTGLRISDLLSFNVQDVNDGKEKIREKITIQEQKTGKRKQFMLNTNTRKALQEHIFQQKLQPGDYLFQSRKGDNQPISRVQAWNILNQAARTVGITSNIGTHTLRKTFGYHAYQNGTDITLLQKVFNHSSPAITLRYIGITQEEIDNVYINLNL